MAAEASSRVQPQGPRARTFFRVTKSNPPSAHDFASNYLKGLPPKGPELSNASLHRGISVWATADQATRAAREFRFLIGRFVAEISIAHEAGIHVRRTMRKPGHHTMWGEPETIRAFVTRVFEVQ